MVTINGSGVSATSTAWRSSGRASRPEPYEAARSATTGGVADTESVFVRKLQLYGTMSLVEVVAAQSLLGEPVMLPKGTDILVEGQACPSCYVLESGWGLRHARFGDGHHRIVEVVLPGDFIGVSALARPMADHSVTTLTPVLLRAVSPHHVREAIAGFPNLKYAFFRATVAGQHILRDTRLKYARYTSYESLHLLLIEIQERLRALEVIERGQPWDLPLSEGILAEAMGIDAEAVRAALRRLREDGCVAPRGSRITVFDAAACATATTPSSAARGPVGSDRGNTIHA